MAMIRAMAAAKMAVPADAKEPIRAAEEPGVPALVRCETEPIRAAAVIRGVQLDVTAADRTCVAIHRVMAAGHTFAAIPCAKGDPLLGLLPGLGQNAACQRNHATAHCVRFPASCAMEPEFVRPCDIRFRVADDPGELSAHPECALAAQSSFRRFVLERHDPAKQRPDCRGPAIRHESDANRLGCLRHGSEPLNDPDPEPDGVR